jgi:taurine--2-oxoglutarate transaminase
VFRIPDFYHGIQRGMDTTDDVLTRTEEVLELEGAKTIAALIVEPVVGTNGILIPPDGYMQGLRKICDKHGILLIADEVMAGFGRTGEWFSVDHWKVVPDLISMAKGLTSAYVQLGAVGMRRQIADHFQNNFFNGGLTYNSHPLACAAGIATIAGVRGRQADRERATDGQRHARLDGRHGKQTSVGWRDAQHRVVWHLRVGAQS